jgi:DNA modification methylase
MGGEKADMVFTDPPYGVAVAGGSHDPRDEKNYQSGGKIQGDALDDDRLYKLWADSLKLSGHAACEGAPVYVCFSDSRALPCLKAFIDSGLKYSQLIIWAKQQMVFGRKDYHSQHEPIMYGWVNGGAHNEVKTRTQTTLWQIDRPMRSEKEHPTQKPIELPHTAINNHDVLVVLDPFLGSGTTMVACQNLNRKCRGIEVSAPYVAVCLERMSQAFPGIEIRKEGVKTCPPSGSSPPRGF